MERQKRKEIIKRIKGTKIDLKEKRRKKKIKKEGEKNKKGVRCVRCEGEACQAGRAPGVGDWADAS